MNDLERVARAVTALTDAIAELQELDSSESRYGQVIEARQRELELARKRLVELRERVRAEAVA